MIKNPIYLHDAAKRVGVHLATIMRWIDMRKVKVRKRKDSQGRVVFTEKEVATLQRYRASVRVAK